MEMTILQFFESIRTEFLNVFFLLATFFGEKYFIIIALCTFYWAVNKKIGEFLLFNTATSLCLNGALKDIIMRPRPYKTGAVTKVSVTNLLIDTIKVDNSYSFPSGHAQICANFFSALSFFYKSKKVAIFAAVTIILVMVSRMYLGLHYPSDVVFGAALGIITAFFWHFIYKSAYDKRYFVFFIIAAIFTFSLFFARSADSFQSVGILIGASGGVFLENKFVNFKIEKCMRKKVLRVFVGLGLLLILKWALGSVLGSSNILSALVYAVIIFFATFIYPLVFKKLSF